MSIKYKLILSFFLLVGLFLLRVGIRFYGIHCTRVMIDRMKGTGPATNDATLSVASRARQLLDQVPACKSDPRLAAVALAPGASAPFGPGR